MSTSDPILDNDQESTKEGSQKNTFGWLSILISVFFIIRGVMEISSGRSTWGSVMLVLGIGGLIFKVWENGKSK